MAIKVLVCILALCQLLNCVLFVSVSGRIFRLEEKQSIQIGINKNIFEANEALARAIRDMRSRYFTAPDVDDERDI
jgi:hypothetical protein